MMIVEGERRDDDDSFLGSLWSLIVKCDDICFTHILPRLNQTDLKFLYNVNSETRKLEKVGEEIVSQRGVEEEV